MFKEFKIIVPSYNTPQWICKCLKSIKIQNNKNYKVCIIDDFSDTDESRNLILKYCRENNWEHIFNTERKYALYNIQKGIEHLNCDDDDVIVLLDGDDWFFDYEVLDKLAENYKDDIYLTYGQYISSAGTDTSLGYTFMPNESIIKNKLYRKIPWLFTHLKTFKYKLFKEINPQHFLDKDGCYFKIAGDLAIMFPIAEMSGGKFKCIDDLLYIYNIDNEISDFRIARDEQIRVDLFIREFPVYLTIV